MVGKQKFVDVCWGCCWGYKLSWQLPSPTFRGKLYNCSGSKVFACSDTKFSKILFHYVLFCDKENRDLWSKIYFFSFGKIPRFAGPLNIFVSLLVPVNKKFIGPNLRWRKKTQNSIKQENYVGNPYFFWLLIDQQDNFHKLWNFWGISL